MSTIERDGVEVYYEAQGEGPVILLSHGYGATAQMWAGQLAPLSEHYRVIAWDMRGHGQTASPEDPGCYSEAETVADMAAILDAEGADDAIIGGLSLGGYMSLAFNLVHPGADACADAVRHRPWATTTRAGVRAGTRTSPFPEPKRSSSAGSTRWARRRRCGFRRIVPPPGSPTPRAGCSRSSTTG